MLFTKISTTQNVAIDGKNFAAPVNNMDGLKYWSTRITEKFVVNVNDDNFS